ncbi:MAG: TIGR00730 family Rossman fold protein, partial [Nanoarchaeota archaeon]
MANICVFCASTNGSDAVYQDVAAQTGTLIGKGGHTLIYGGSNCGLMGIVARATQAAGGKVVGILPNIFSDLAQGEDELVRAEDLRHRKALMEVRSDAFMGLPGGIGTLDEIADALVSAYLGIHKKPIVIVNTHGFYRHLLAHFEQIYTAQFGRPSARDLYHFVEEPVQG